MKKNDHSALLDEVQSNLEDSNSNIETLRDDWDDLEAMLIVKLNDQLSATSENKIYDPRLSTIVFERASRVMAQNPKGMAYAQSKDDLGKNALMNLLLKHFYKNANEQDTMLLKLRLMDVYSLVYGSMFGLVPWRVGKNYIGPELNILPIRDCFPQAGKKSVSDMDFFTVRNVVSIDWLKQQDKSVWMNVDKLAEDLKNIKSDGDAKSVDDTDKRSFVERTMYPSTYSSISFPQVELYTEYRRDRWITWSPQHVNSKTSQPYILRISEDAYPDDMLPIITKHAFPLLDSPIGLGEFARGASLQNATNSLWNLYMEGVKYSIFPPLHINPAEVVPSSIKWGAGEFWYMNTPNTDVQPMRIDAQGINTFQSTFGTLISSIETQAGTTSVRESANSQSSLGKTPEAIRFISEKESARDEWDRVMMEQTIDQLYSRWIALTVNKMEKSVHMRLFKEEIADIQEVYPDVVELYDSGRGGVTIKKKDIDDKYDFVLETGSTTKPDIEGEQNNLTVILKAVLENPQIIEALAQNGKTVDLAELFKRWLVAGNAKDWDKIIIDLPQEEPVEETQLSPQDQELMAQNMPMEQPMDPMQGQPMPQPMPMEDPRLAEMAGMIQDPEIQQALMQTIRDRTGGIPVQ